MSKTRKPTKVAQFGLGPIGVNAAKLVASRGDLHLVGGIDINPQLAGKTLAEACGIEGNNGRVYRSFAAMLEDDVRPDVILHTAGSRAALSIEQCLPMLEAGLAVVSSCEELLYPWHRAPEAADGADKLCRRTGGRILGTGVNPGFVLDLLPVCLSGVCREVRGIRGERVVNASTRRQPLQKKIGSGMDPGDFRALWREGKAGHAGFQESLLLVAHAMGWEIDSLEENLEPVIAETRIKTDHFTVEAGQTRGLHQVVQGRSRRGHVIHLDLKMYLDAPDPHDFVHLDGDPPVSCRLENGVAGDIATVAALVNCIPRLLAAPAGVRLMTDIPLSGANTVQNKSVARSSAAVSISDRSTHNYD